MLTYLGVIFIFKHSLLKVILALRYSNLRLVFRNLYTVFWLEGVPFIWSETYQSDNFLKQQDSWYYSIHRSCKQQQSPSIDRIVIQINPIHSIVTSASNNILYCPRIPVYNHHALCFAHHVTPIYIRPVRKCKPVVLKLSVLAAHLA
jgi:hypothetical protein